MMKYPTKDQYLCSYDDVLNKIDGIDPKIYAASRNHLDGAVSWLSPFITHGIIDTSVVASRLLVRHPVQECTKFLFELAWREYFHRVWQQHGDNIFQDMRPRAGETPSEKRYELPPTHLLAAQTGIRAIDECIAHLLSDGLMHNHARMWTASLACNIANTHWLQPAKWMHYHLLDGDLASNTLSWQWVAGTFSNKRYIANQDNINKFSKDSQHASFLDMSYEEIATMDVPRHLKTREEPDYDLTIPAGKLEISGASVAIRSLWNLDHTWCPDAEQQILFVDTAHYEKWPMSPNRWEFIQHWAQAMPGITIMAGTASELNAACEGKTVYRREYPATESWPGEIEPRDWLYHLPQKKFNSFFAFWKQVCGDVGLKV